MVVVIVRHPKLVIWMGDLEISMVSRKAMEQFLQLVACGKPLAPSRKKVEPQIR